MPERRTGLEARSTWPDACVVPPSGETVAPENGEHLD